MKYFEIFKKALVLTFILFNLLNLPFIAFSYSLNATKNLDAAINLNYDDLTLISSLREDEPHIESNLGIIGIENIFDSSLNEFLYNYSLKYKPVSERVKVIMLFKEEVSKFDRIAKIDKLLDNYEIIRNYKIIPGVSLICNSAELISKQEALGNVNGLIKIYKSQFYKNPEYTEESPSISSLDYNYFPNWWISAVGAEDLAYDGTGVRVAVVDTGIYEHPDLNIVANQSFVTGDLLDSNDDYGHGTHAAGIIGGSGISSSGEYRGIAPGVSLINARAGNFEGLNDTDVIDAIEWCVLTAGADIISMSFGGGLPEFNDPMTLTISNAANNYGVILVSSAGNSGPDYFTGGSPASGNDVISVGATDINNNLASFTSWGPTFTYLGYPDVVAPGVNIIAAEALDSVLSDRQRYIGDYFDFSGDGDYITLSGTSMSCPVVAGALAILKEAYPSITPETSRIALLEGAQPLSNYENDDTLKFGAGLINVTASLDYMESLSPDKNDTARFFPDIIPLQPFDLLNFPGDKQSFNITIISGKANNYSVNIPTKVNGLKLILDKTTLNFSEENVKFITLDIEIEQNALPGVRNFELNLTDGLIEYDSIDIAINVKFPEYKILMESFHGLNDWFPEISFYQMDFYDFMKDMTNLNISIDYGAEYWSPYYDADYNNSLLTEERLAQYDLILLQNPILPYTPEEMKNIKNYFDHGGNILFLGTRYQDLCVDNINELFSVLGSNITINQENIYSENWLGIGASVNSQSVSELNSISIFNNVEKFEWSYGHTFNVGSGSESIATLNDKTVAAIYNETPSKGKLITFGDLHWISKSYSSSSYQLDHARLTRNLMEYFFSDKDVSIHVVLDSERTSNSQFNISVYVKDLSSGIPISSSVLNTNLSITINNSGFSESIETISLEDGIVYNSTYSLSSPDYRPYDIIVNFTFGSKTYHKFSKLLYFNSGSVPVIEALTVSSNVVTRAPGDSTQLRVDLDSISYSVDAYLSIYSYSFYNTKQTINKTFPLSYSFPFYRYTYDPSTLDPAGIAIYYIVPQNTISNYTNPYSPRYPFEVRNNNPSFVESNSFITIDGQNSYAFDDTYEGESSLIIQVSQGNNLDFIVDSSDLNYEDANSSSMRVSVNLFIISTTDDGFINIIYPNTLPLKELTYQSSSDIHRGNLIIPFTITYESITGIKEISSATNYDPESGEGYLAILIITIVDSEGGSEDFLIALLIRASIPLELLLLLLVIGIAVALGSIILIVLLRKSRRSKALEEPSEYYPQEYYITPTEDTSYDSIPTDTEGYRTGFYCPYCGYNIGAPKSFCPNCGKSLYFETQ
jgi:serine protease AprX